MRGAIRFRLSCNDGTATPRPQVERYGVVGANVHDRRLVSSTLATLMFPRPQPTPDTAQHLCLDKGDDYPRVEVEVPRW